MAWLTGWNYRKSITVSNSGSTLTDYQILVTIDTASLVTAGKMRSDCGDIRFASSDGSTLLNYWIESGCNNASTKIWAKIPSIANGNNAIYVYYGNTTPPSDGFGSNGTNTFDFFDDFSGNLSKWNKLGSPTIVSGELAITGNGTWDTNVVRTVATFGRPLIIEWKEKGATTCVHSVSGYFSSLVLGEGYLSLYKYITQCRDYGYHAGETMLGYPGGGLAETTNYDKYTLAILPTSGFNIYRNGTLFGSTIIGTENNWGIGFNVQSSVTEHYDDVRIRKYTATEPTTCAGGEEVQTASWLTNWNRRKLMTITGSTSGAQTDYQMKITVHKSSGTDTSTDIYLGANINNDFSDLRFTSNDGSTLLSYWIESYTSGSVATVLVKIPSIPTGPCTTTIYMYYNNPSASSVSNGTNTFDLFDDFEDGNYNGWTLGGVASPTLTMHSDNTYYVEASAGSTGIDNRYIIAYRGESVTSGIIEGRFKLRNSNAGMAFRHSSDNSFYFMEFVGTSVYLTKKYSASSGGYTRYPGANAVGNLTGTFYPFKLTTTSGGVFTLLINGVTNTWTNTDLGAGNWGFAAYQTEGAYFDDIRVRKYISPEPTFSTIGTEEITTGDLNISSTPVTGASVYIDGNVTASGVTPLIVTGFTPGTHTYRLTKSGYTEIPATNFTITAGQTTTISQAMLTVANITATNMTITPSDTPCIAGSCIVTIVVRWSNSGETNGTVIPNIKIDNMLQIAHASRNVLAGSYIDEVFTISGMSVGTHNICPDPNL